MATYLARKNFWWPWSPVVKKQYGGYGKCPYCGWVNEWMVMMDDSFKLTPTGFKALVSCTSHTCGKQIRLTVRDGKTTATKVAK